MTPQEQQLVHDLALHGLPQQEFLRRFRSSSDGKELAVQLLKEAYHNRDADVVEYALIVGFTFGFPKSSFYILRQLFGEDWHFKHEDIVSALEELKDPAAIDTFYNATQYIPEYLDYDDSRALAVKAIWALSKLNNPEADMKLAILSKSDDPILKREALYQLQRKSQGK